MTNYRGEEQGKKRYNGVIKNKEAGDEDYRFDIDTGQ